MATAALEQVPVTDDTITLPRSEVRRLMDLLGDDFDRVAAALDDAQASNLARRSFSILLRIIA